MGLPRWHRLRERPAFLRLYRAGKRQRGPTLTLRVYPHGGDASQFGIVVSQKVSKRAVVRNRLKRLIRVAIRQLLPHVARGWQVLITLNPGAPLGDSRLYLQELEELLARVGLLHGHS
ncbi:MAG: ribonuclease P protein component [Gloeomargaritaceae cyanobacterium C42_A2020_066]|nr:ribonuclease P protein component [Gloeomargaritaceae cyanobacterium C42_A2020_066]